MSPQTPLSPRLYFSYSQFLVYDTGEKSPGCLWTDAHIAQGFARRESAVSFGTVLEFGYADVFLRLGLFEHDEEYHRVIAVPFVVLTGKVQVDGPEEIGVGRGFELPVGNYRFVAAQRVMSPEEELIDLFVERVRESPAGSQVIVADNLLNPPARLLETAEIA